MPVAFFLFHAELNDFLPKQARWNLLEVGFKGHETTKHLLESLGVPHTEVDIILINGTSVDFTTRLKDGDRVDIYPISEELDIVPIIHLQPTDNPEPRFVLDGHLGKLASYLRLLGFDTIYHNDFEDDELAEISSSENRILLTRDRGLLKRNQVRHGYCIRSRSPQKQVIEVLRRFDLAENTKPFSRCAQCNGLLKPVAKVDVFDRLEPKTKIYYDDFRMCQCCAKIFWKGSHFERLGSQLQVIIDLSDEGKNKGNIDDDGI